MLWNKKKGKEETNFFGRSGDKFASYVNGKNSKFGYLVFYQYVVNLDDGVANPFYSLHWSQEINYSTYGCHFDENEEVLISKGSVSIANCYVDILFSNPEK